MQSGSCEPVGAGLKLCPPALWYFPPAGTWWSCAAELSLSDTEAEPWLKPGSKNFVFMVWLEVSSSWGDRSVWRLLMCWVGKGALNPAGHYWGTLFRSGCGYMWLQCFRDAQRPHQNQIVPLPPPRSCWHRRFCGFKGNGIGEVT